VVTFGACVGVLPFLDDDCVLVVRQYRNVQGENHRWEMPTGGVHPGETPEAAAQRAIHSRRACSPHARTGTGFRATR
jgi:8-oxo-dGTP pyrophosphatase MutT (NUDIX family)